jgi:peroxiredoxin
MMPYWKTSSAPPTRCLNVEDAIWPILILALLLTSPALLAEQKLGHTLSPLSTPYAAPSFALQDMDDEVVTLESLRGKVVLLNFWATWCPPCRREMPSMERVYRAMSGEPFTVVAINEYEDADHVFAYVGQLGTNPSFPILFDPDSSVAEAYNVRGLPSTYLIDKRGHIRYRAIGGREYDHPEVISIIEGLLREK